MKPTLMVLLVFLLGGCLVNGGSRPTVQIESGSFDWKRGQTEEFTLVFHNGSEEAYHYRAGSACTQPVAWIQEKDGSKIHLWDRAGPTTCADAMFDVTVAKGETVVAHAVWNGSEDPSDPNSDLVAPGEYDLWADFEGTDKSWETAAHRSVTLRAN